jgi:hypothetical protein
MIVVLGWINPIKNRVDFKIKNMKMNENILKHAWKLY